MKRLAALLFLSLLIVNKAISQSSRDKNGLSLGVGFIFNDFETVRAISKSTYPTHKYTPFQLDRTVPGISMTLESGIASYFDCSLTISGSFTDSGLKRQTANFSQKHLFLEMDASVKANILSTNSRFQPYVQSGIGVAYFNQYAGIFVPLGLGLHTRIIKDVFGNIDFQYRQPVTTIARHFYYSVGISSSLTRSTKKRVNKTPKVERNAITVSLDADKDGIVDSLDSCPVLPGLQRFNGCPDSDQDGITDHEDMCPYTFGTKELHGCPPADTDGDGVADTNDLCPDIPGFKTNEGCPVKDRDSDGLEDDKDSCPDLLGPITSKGCPLVDTAIIQAVEKAAKHIYFLTGSYELSKSSYAHLDAISQILLKNQGLKLLIEGHTDNVGTMVSNQKLSENRVVSVITYLKATGVKEERLKFNAYGQSRPIESNAVAKGRQANRRVELSVSYSY